MTSIGFEAHSREDFEKLAEYAFNSGERIKTKKGIYSFSEFGQGIELWLQMNKNNEIIGLDPHYSGLSRIKVRITNEIISNSDSILDGSFHAWADPDESEESGAYPFVFDMPNRANYGDIDLPQIISIQLVAFADELSVFDTEDDFNKSQDGELKFAAESFIPSGLFGDQDAPSATAIFTGKVIETSLITNEYTGVSFSWSLVKTLGGEIDVVVDKDLLSKEIFPGGIITGSFWLSAKFIDNPVLKEKSIFQRLIGR
jgi:hypothetical protein